MRFTRVSFMLLLLAVAPGFAGCQSPSPRAGGRPGPVPIPSPDAAVGAGLSPADVEAGRRLYGAKCARCHRFYDPAAYDSTRWAAWMTKMSRKAKLQPRDEQLLRRYLDAFRVGPTPGADAGKGEGRVRTQ